MDPKALFRYFMFFINDTEGRETFVMQLDKPDEHYTLQIRRRERMLDLHKTQVLPGGQKTYETLFQMSFYQVYRFFVILSKEGKRLEQCLQTLDDVKREFGLRPVNPGWFRRNYMAAVHADLDRMKDVGLFRTKNRGRQVRLTKDPNKIDPNALFLQVHSQMEPGKYVLLKWNKGGTASFAGALFVLPEGAERFMWIAKKYNNAMVKKLALVLMNETGRLNGPMGQGIHTELRKRYPLRQEV